MALALFFVPLPHKPRILESAFQSHRPASVDLHLTQSQQELGIGPLLLHGLMLNGFPLAEHVRQAQTFEMMAQALIGS